MTKNFEYINKKLPKATDTAKQLSEYFDTLEIDLSKGLAESKLKKVFVCLVDDYLKYKLVPRLTLGPL